MRRPFILGLTGGIGSGKSTVSKLLQKRGAFLIDADEISRHALDIGTDCYIQTVQAFGKGILNEDASVNRKALAGIVFQDIAQRERLNGIIHPYVRKTIYAQTERAETEKCTVVVWDIPLLLEGGYEKETDAVLVVTCPLETRLERLRNRSGFSREEALARMRAQMTDEERSRKADFVIDNGGTLEALENAVGNVWNTLLERQNAKEEQ